MTPASVNAKIQSRTTIEKSDIKVCKQSTNYLQGYPQGWRLQRRLYEILRIIKRKTNSENVSTPKVGVLNVEFALKLRIHRSLKVQHVSNESERSLPQHCILS